MCEQQLPISAVLLQRRDLVHLEISPAEWRILEDVIKVLHPFKIATQHLSGESYTTISALGPLLSEIKKRLGADANDSVAIQAFKKALRDDMDSRYIHPEVKVLLNKASFLDPRFKTLKHLSCIQQEEVSDMLFDEVVELVEENTSAAVTIVDGPSTSTDDGEPRGKKAKSVLVVTHSLMWLLVNVAIIEM